MYTGVVVVTSVQGLNVLSFGLLFLGINLTRQQGCRRDFGKEGGGLTRGVKCQRHYGVGSRGHETMTTYSGNYWLNFLSYVINLKILFLLAFSIFSSPLSLSCLFCFGGAPQASPA